MKKPQIIFEENPQNPIAINLHSSTSDEVNNVLPVISIIEPSEKQLSKIFTTDKPFVNIKGRIENIECLLYLKINGQPIQCIDNQFFYKLDSNRESKKREEPVSQCSSHYNP